MENYNPVKQIFLELYFNPDQRKSAPYKVRKAYNSFLFFCTLCMKKKYPEAFYTLPGILIFYFKKTYCTATALTNFGGVTSGLIKTLIESAPVAPSSSVDVAVTV